MLLTAQAAAVAHAAPGPSGTMELCTGSGPVMVYVDAEGTPIGDPVFCPDYALSLILALDLPPVAAVPVAGVGETAGTRLRDHAVAGPRHHVLRARGPPAAI